MFATFFGENYVRKKLLNKTQSSVMKEYLEKPFPNKNEIISNLNVISLDFETTGLDIEKDRVVSIGWVSIEHMGVNLKSCYHQLIKTKKDLPEISVVIHQITDNQLVNGISIDEALPCLLKQLSGKVLLAHNAKVELGFINKMCQKLYNTNFIIPVIDTQYLAKRSLDRQNQSYKGSDLRLFNLRKTFNLPAYKAHNALKDAVATAELFLAMVSKISSKNNARLSDFLS